MKTLRALLFAAFGLLFAFPVHASNDVVAKNWWPMTICFDGLLHSEYPLGDCPSGFQTTPTLLDTDVVDVDTTHGENSQGGYVSLFGYSLGRGDTFGTSAGTRIYFRNTSGPGAWTEVNNYRALNISVVWPTIQVVRAVVQVGSLGGMAAGTVMDIMGCQGASCPSSGTITNILTAKITVQPGRQAFVSLTGNDATGVFDDPTKPFRYVQNYSGSAPVAGSLWAATTTMGETGLRAGDTVVMRGGNWSDQLGFESHFMRFRQQTGNAPNGTIGNGYYKFTCYPGPANGNAVEDCHWTGAVNGAGGFHGSGSTNAGLGGGQYWVVSNLRLEQQLTTTTDAAPINGQYGCMSCRFFSVTVGPWPNNNTTAKAGGITGGGDNMLWKFNYVHDIAGDTAQENHCMYVDENYAHVSTGVELAYNWLTDCTNGSGIQFNNSVGTGAFTGELVHHNYINNAKKSGIVMGSSSQSASIYNNIVIGSGWNSMRVTNSVNTSSLAINITHNTFVQSTTTASGVQAMYDQDDTRNVGSIKLSHNIWVLTAGHTNITGFAVTAGSASVFDQNLFWDLGGSIVTYPTDANKVTSNPLFTNQSSSDYTLQSGSPGRNGSTTADPLALPTDLFGIARPVTGTGACGGAPCNDIGATQGAGT